MKGIAILGILLMASYTDIRKQEVPVIYQVLLLCLVPFGFRLENLWGIAIAIPFFIAAVATDRIGGGDFKVIAILGILLGFYEALCTVIAGCLIFIFSSLVIGRIKGKGNTLFPFIPSLTLGYVGTLVLEAII